MGEQDSADANDVGQWLAQRPSQHGVKIYVEKYSQ